MRKQYRGVWSKWVSWCDKRNCNPLQSSVEDVTNFIADSYTEGKSYSTLNTYRSALSSSLCPCDNSTVGSHPSVTRLFKGIFNLRPPQPRYSETWNVSLLTKYLKELPPLGELTLKVLTLKTVTLCVLVSAQRSQTLATLDLDNMIISESSIKFVISERLKTSRPGQPTITVCFPSIDDTICLCPKRCLIEYISRTRDLRNSSNLFISFIKPHKAISTETLAR